MVKKGDGFKGDVYSFLQVCEECKKELKEKWCKGEDKRYAIREKERLDYIDRRYEYNPVSNEKIEEIEEKEWVCEHCQVEGTCPYYLELCQDCCRKLHPDYDKKEYSEMLGYLYSMLGSQCERIEVLNELNARFVSDVALNAFENGTSWSGEMMRAIAKLIQKAQIIK
jgi:RecJ-like exonuclease